IDLLPFSMSNKGVVMDYPRSQYRHHMVAIDLSHHKFLGEIPNIMGNLNPLTFLDFFNASFNNLSDSIPENRQLLTFGDNSFIGNKDLCEIQLLKKCEDPLKLPLQKPDGDQDLM
ncbi:hypothetical protein S245_030494, partial [Arachis hypogaea]